MKRSFLIFLSFFIVFYVYSDKYDDAKSHNLDNYDKKSRDIFQSWKKGKSKVNQKGTKEKEKILITSLKPINVDVGIADAVTENMIYLLSSYKLFEVINKAEASRKANKYTEDYAFREAKFANAGFAIIGTITGLGDQFTINLQLLDVNTKEIVIGYNEIADSEKELFGTIKKISDDISKNETIMKNYLKDLKKVVILDFEPIGLDKKNLAQEISDYMIYNISDFSKYYSIDRTEIIKVSKELKIDEKQKYTDEAALKIGTKLEAVLAIFGNVSKSGKDMIIEAKAIDIKSGKIVFGKKIKTMLDYQMEVIAERISQTISDDKNLVVNEEVLDIDKEKYEIIIKHNRDTWIALLSSGLTTASLGLLATAAGAATYGVYMYQQNTNTGHPVYTQRLVPATIGLWCAGIPIMIGGIIVSALSSYYYEIEKKYKKLLEMEEKKTSYMPVLEFSYSNINLGLSIRF